MNKKLLQVKIENHWHYVFCRNELKALPVITTDKSKALPASALDYFQRYFASLNFRIV